MTPIAIEINCLDYAVHAAKEVSERGYQPIIVAVNKNHAVTMWKQDGLIHVMDNGKEWITPMRELPAN